MKKKAKDKLLFKLPDADMLYLVGMNSVFELSNAKMQECFTIIKTGCLFIST